MQSVLKIIVISIVLNSINIFAQNDLTIKGNVYDSSDKSPLIGVDVFVKGLNIGAATNNEGFFELKNLRKGKYAIQFSSIGYAPITKTVNIGEKNNVNLKIEMEQSAINLNEVVVTGNPFEIEPKDISQTTVSLSKLDLLVKQGGTVGQTLDFQPGISMRSNGVATGRPVIRGFSNNMVLIVENGLRMGDLSSASDDHSVSNSGSEPEKIEVIEGPSSLLYGSNAIGGVVNVISDAIPSVVQQGLNGFALGGLTSVNNQFLENIHLNYGINKFAFHGTYAKRKGKNYKVGGGEETFNSDVDTHTSEFGMSFHPDWGTVGLSYANYGNLYGLPTLPTADEIVYIDMHKKEYRFLTNVEKINSFITSLSLKAGYLNYNHNEVSRIDGSIGTSFGLKTYTADLSFNHKPLFKNTNGIFGIYSLIQNYNVTGKEALTPAANYYNYAFYFLEHYKLNNFNLQAGARYEINQIKFPDAVLTDSLFKGGEKNYNNLSASLGAVYNLTESYSIFANVANAFRSPTIEELSSYAVHDALASFDIGNRNLKTLNNIGFDAGMRFQNKKYYGEISGYYNIINNFIARSPLNLFYDEDSGFNNIGNGFRIHKYTQEDAYLYGFETKISYEILDGLTGTLISDYVAAKNRDTNENLPQIPPFRFGLELRYATPDYWFGGNLKIAGAQNKVAPNEEPTAGYELLDVYAGARFSLGNFISIVSLKANNIFDKKYKDHLSAIKDFTYMPGRNISINYKFIF